MFDLLNTFIFIYKIIPNSKILLIIKNILLFLTLFIYNILFNRKIYFNYHIIDF